MLKDKARRGWTTRDRQQELAMNLKMAPGANQDTDRKREQQAALHLKAALEVQKDLGIKDISTINGVIARKIIEEEHEMYGKYGHLYDFNEGIRDRLLAHTRQDSANSLLNTISLLKETRKLRVLMTMQLIIVTGILLKLLF
jgi:hypothetical protein